MRWLRNLWARFFGGPKFDWDSQNYGEPKEEDGELNKLNGGL